MGRIKTSFIKNVAQELFERYGNEFTTNFGKNKELIEKICEIKSKRLRNMIAGYITSLKKREKS
ncbi:MAG: 30S ribosomal protein S17e [Candidatus Aenigmarchaeota archaeon]|nr:30S ribosomal protein S17e [Candidatus Aenigmarchaeota archaeon]